MNASPDTSAMLAAEEAALQGRLKRAVSDVMEGHSISEVYRRRQVPEARLRAALVAAGWTFRNKPRATQLPRSRSDNQS